LDTSTETNDSLEKDIEQLNDTIAARKAELKDAAAEQKRLLDLQQDLETAMEQHKQSLEELSDEKQTLQSQLREHQQKIAQSEKARGQLESELKAQQAAYEQQLETALQEITSLQDQADSANKEIESLNLELASLKETERLYHLTLKDIESIRQITDDLQLKLEAKMLELDKARLSISKGLEVQQSLEEQLGSEINQSRQLAEEKAALEDQISTVTDSLTQVRNKHLQLQEQYISQTHQLETERTENRQEVATLQQDIDQTSKQNEVLNNKVVKLKETQQQYHAALEKIQTFEKDIEELNTMLESKKQQQEKTESSLNQTRQQLQSIEEELSYEQKNTETLEQQKQELLGQEQEAASILEQTQQTVQQLRDELEYRKRQFQKELESKEQQTHILQQRLSETTEQIHEFEPLLESAHDDNVKLQQTIKKNTEQIAQLQSKIAKQNIEYTTLREKLSDAENRPIELPDSPNGFESAQIRIQLLTQDLEKETEFNQSARGQIDNNNEHIEQIEEQLAQKTENLKSLRKDMEETKQQLTHSRKELATLQRSNLNAVSLEKKLREANSRIESLGAQVKEQIVSLKNAHQTINFLRAQKGSRSYKVPGLDGPGHEVVSAPKPPQPIP
jgi:chromosome segregation ATPase